MDNNPYRVLMEAVRLLASHCDGAHTYDDQGFNKIDSTFGKSLAAQERWSPKQASAAYKMVRKYAAQLERGGIPFDSIPNPETLSDWEAPKPRRIATLEKDRSIVLDFPYDPAIVADVRGVDGARFDGKTKTWIVRPDRASPRLGAVLETHGFDFPHNIAAEIARVEYEHLRMEQVSGVLKEASFAKDSDVEIEGLGGELRPFQKAAVEYAYLTKRLIIGDQMGLGKTPESLAALQKEGAFPALIVVPATVKINWQREATKWLPGRQATVVSGNLSKDKKMVKEAVYALRQPDILIFNYDILASWVPALKQIDFKAIVCDESHMVKTKKAARSKAVAELAKTIPIRYMLTGTPVINRPVELINQLAILGRLEDMGGFWYFAKRFCGGHQGSFGLDLTGATNLKELNEKLRSVCYIRRQKSEVLTELPAKQRAVQLMDIDNRKEYERAKSDLISWIRENAEHDQIFRASLGKLSPEQAQMSKEEYADDKANRARSAQTLVRIEALKTLAARGKLGSVIEWIKTFLESGEKLVVFARHIEIQRALIDAFDDCAHLMGADSQIVRQQNVDRFQEDPDCKLMILSLDAGGVGITLTAASNVAFCELGWTPALMEQAEDRTHRIGQLSSVTAWYLLAENTIDEQIAALLDKKAVVTTAATEGGDVPSGSLLGELVGGLLSE